MAIRTIPEPTNTDFAVALTGVKNLADTSGLAIDHSGLQPFLVAQAELVAQQAAEIRWLRNIIHKNLIPGHPSRDNFEE